MKQIELSGNWSEQIESHLHNQIEKIDPCNGWWWDDCRFDYEYGSIRGIAGEIYQDYDSARHDSVESIQISLHNLPIVTPYDEEELIKTVNDLIEYIQIVIIDEFPTIDCEDWPDLRLIAKYNNTVDFLNIDFEFRPVK